MNFPCVSVANTTAARYISASWRDCPGHTLDLAPRRIEIA
jgi:hypothetical protein